MDDIPPSVAIVFMVCVAIITVTIIVCDCEKQKYAAPDNDVVATKVATKVATDNLKERQE